MPKSSKKKVRAPQPAPTKPANEPLPFEVPAAGLFVGRQTIHRRAEPVWRDPDAYVSSQATADTTRMHLVAATAHDQWVILARLVRRRLTWREWRVSRLRRVDWIFQRRGHTWEVRGGQFPEFNAYLAASMSIHYPAPHTFPDEVRQVQTVVTHFWHQYLSCVRYTVMNLHALPQGQTELYQPATILRHVWEGVTVKDEPNGNRVWRHARVMSEPEPPPSLRIVQNAKNQAVRDQDFELASRLRDIESDLRALLEEKGVLNFEANAVPHMKKMGDLLMSRDAAKAGGKKPATEEQVVDWLAKTYKVVGDAVKPVDKKENP